MAEEAKEEKKSEESAGKKKETAATEEKKDEPIANAKKDEPAEPAKGEEASKPGEDAGSKDFDSVAVKNLETAKASVSKEDVSSAEPDVSPKPSKTFTQDEVNGIVSERVSETKGKAVSTLLQSLGFKTPEDLAEAVKEAPELHHQVEELSGEVKQLKEEKALADVGVDPMRQEDVRIYFKGLGEPITYDELKSKVAAHPEWLGTQPVAKPATMQVLGNQGEEKKPEDEEEEAKKIFGDIGVKL